MSPKATVRRLESYVFFPVQESWPVMNESTVSRKVVVTNPQGLHARPADQFVRLASRFSSRVELVKGSERVDGKSILSLLTLAATEGTQLSIEATGSDAEQALEALADLVAHNFHCDEDTVH